MPVSRDLAYRHDMTADRERHILDVYSPNNAKSKPVVMLIHGGVWKQGHKRVFNEPAAKLAEQGFVVVCPNYRLSPAVTHPAHIQDIATVFDWVKQSIDKYGGDPKRIAVAGHSAGGHLAALLSTDEQYLKAHGRSIKEIATCIGISGVYRITTHESYRHAFGADESVCRKASPIEQSLDATPPMLLLYADHDIPMMDRQAKDFEKALQAKQQKVSVEMIKDRDHHSIVSHMKHADDTALAIIVRHLKTLFPE